MYLKLAIILSCIVAFAAVFVILENQSNLHSINPYIKEYYLGEGSKPNALVVRNDGTVWVSTSLSKVVSIEKDASVISHPIGSISNSSMVWTMLDDGQNIWLAPLGTKSVWYFVPDTSSFNKIILSNGAPFQMKLNRDGNIWYTTLHGDKVGVIQKHDSGFNATTFDVGNNTSPGGIFVDGQSLWITKIVPQKISQYDIVHNATNITGLHHVRDIPQNNVTISTPTDIQVFGGSVWTTEHGTSFLTRYDLGTGQITRYPTSANVFHTTTLPFWMRVTPDMKSIWFNEHQGNKIGLFDLQNNTMIEYAIPSLPKDGLLTYSLNIALDPNDSKILWFSEWNTDMAGVIDGHVKIPFDIITDTKKIELGKGLSEDVFLDITKQSTGHQIYLNASSSITSTAELGSLKVTFSGTTDSDSNRIQMHVYDGGVKPGNYTLGASVSDGQVSKTRFFNLQIR